MGFNSGFKGLRAVKEEQLLLGKGELSSSGYYAAGNVNSLQTFRDNFSVPLSKKVS